MKSSRPSPPTPIFFFFPLKTKYLSFWIIFMFPNVWGLIHLGLKSLFRNSVGESIKIHTVIPFSDRSLEKITWLPKSEETIPVPLRPYRPYRPAGVVPPPWNMRSSGDNRGPGGDWTSSPSETGSLMGRQVTPTTWLPESLCKVETVDLSQSGLKFKTDPMNHRAM